MNDSRIDNDRSHGRQWRTEQQNSAATACCAFATDGLLRMGSRLPREPARRATLAMPDMPNASPTGTALFDSSASVFWLAILRGIRFVLLSPDDDAVDANMCSALFGRTPGRAGCRPRGTLARPLRQWRGQDPPRAQWVEPVPRVPK